ncbi:M23 family metallopeptidase [Clostridioides mangenotii]|uniref:M23 family metallopeptidase n=1 Tax=Metaclostridioides mangenotii TaxID=1540 RepID=UPI001C0FE735|nr:M23 family metallopeptidase [Clostridioides mangenotii]MBU5308010.1 M23 family metallopeptidase [Clostridioides mangenotii]MCR1955780.1 M23 family metallopeptidase [Clostridioides mangenotii]
MKKKLLEKDGFYLSLFVCVCLIAVGGVWFTNSNVDKLASNNEKLENSNKDNEIHLIENNKNDKVPTATDSKQNLENAKQKDDKDVSKAENKTSKLSYLGTEILRGYSEKEPTYSKTLDVWEIHKALDISSEKGSEVKSLTNGVVEDVFSSDKYGYSVKVKDEDKGIVVVYSNLDKDTKVVKDQKIEEGQVMGKVGDSSRAESEDGTHVHLEVYKNDKLIDPSELLK